MGGLKKTRSNVTFLTVRNGLLVRRVKEPTEDSESRTITKGKNEGNVVHEEFFDALEGRIQAVEKREADVSFQPEKYVTLEIIVKDSDGDVYSVSLDYSSGYSRGFFTRAEAVDFSKDVEIKTYWIKGDDGKSRGFLGLVQGGEKINPLYSRNDGIMPSVEPIMKGKKVVAYDDDALMLFYDNILSKLDIGHIDQSEEAKQVSDLPADEDSDYDAPPTGGAKF